MKSIKDMILTIFERERVLNFLDQFDQIIYKPEISVKNYISENFTGEELETISSSLLSLGESPEALASQSKSLRQEIEGLPVLVLTVPMSIDQNLASRICQKARSTTGVPVIIDLKSDPALIGGAVVEGNGRVGEYSFRRYFSKN